MTALVDRLEQLAGEATPGPWLDSEWWHDRGLPKHDIALVVELRNALPALLTALRAAHHVTEFGWDAPHHHPKNAAMLALDDALEPLFGEDTTP